MQSDNCTILIKLNGQTAEAWFLSVPADEYGNPPYYEIEKLLYKGVDVWPVLSDCMIDEIETAITEAELIEAQFAAESRAEWEYERRGT